VAEVLRRSAGRVQEALDKFGLKLTVIEMKESTRTAQEAADAVGCTVGQIAKSLIFRGGETAEPLLVIASGANRVNEKRVGDYAGEKVVKPDAEYVLAKTGYAIGGIPPVGHAQTIRCLIDEDIFVHKEIWAAAGTPNAVFRLTPAELLTITGGQVVKVK
jgi:prolyl-tRNA editing enzyme YbaK/EbsC (Cys-tRNA(Pro) deacylase)